MCIFYFPYHIRMYMHGSVCCIIVLYYVLTICIFLNLCILQNSIFLTRAYCASSLLDWPLNITSQNVWHIQPCVYVTCSYETPCTAKGSVIDLGRGMFFCLHPEAQKQENRDHLSLTYLMVLQPVGVLALLSLGFPLEIQTDFWNSCFRIMSTISSEVTDFCILFYNINCTHRQSYLKCEFCYVRTTNTTKQYPKNTFEIPEETQSELSFQVCQIDVRTERLALFSVLTKILNWWQTLKV